MASGATLGGNNDVARTRWVAANSDDGAGGERYAFQNGKQSWTSSMSHEAAGAVPQ